MHCPNPSKSQQKRIEVQQDRDEEPETETPTPTERVKRWRADNPEKYRDYMRRYMRRRRGGV